MTLTTARGGEPRSASGWACCAGILLASGFGLPTVIAAQGVVAPHQPAIARAHVINDGTGGDHYFLEQLSRRDSIARRWPERTAQPIRVWIQPLRASCACAPLFPSLVREALAEWDTVGLPVRFKEVRDSSAAELHVTWSERLGRDESGRAVWWSTPEGWITRARITIRTHSDAGVLESSRNVRAVVLHEVGHALGLGHVSDPRHIMSEWIESTRLSGADRLTAALLYRVPAGRVTPSVLAQLTMRPAEAVASRDRVVAGAIEGAP